MTFSCKYCPLNGFTKTTLKKHIWKNHNDQFLRIKCPICNESYFDNDMLEIHFLEVHTESSSIEICNETGKYICDQCYLKCVYANEIYTHLQKKHLFGII